MEKETYWELYLDSVAEEHQECRGGQHHSVYTINIRYDIAEYKDQGNSEEERSIIAAGTLILGMIGLG